MDDQSLRPDADRDPTPDPPRLKHSSPTQPSLPFLDVPSMQLGTALSRVPPPLADAAHAAAAQPFPLHPDDIDLLADIPWGTTDLDPFPLGDTQYLQLGSDTPQEEPSSTPTSVPSPPPKPTRPKSAEAPKRRRTPVPKSPVPIAPRGKDHPHKRKHATRSATPPPPFQKTVSETLKPNLSASTPLDTTNSFAIPSPSIPPVPLNHFPVPLPPHAVQPGMIPLMNIGGACMYPLQHHQPVMPPHTVQTDVKTQAIPRSVSANAIVRNDSKKLRVSEVTPSAPFSSHPTTQFMPPVVPVMPYNPNLLSFVQFTAAQQIMAAAAAGYPTAIPNVPQTVSASAAPSHPRSPAVGEKQQDNSCGGEIARQNAKGGQPVVLSDEGSTYLVPQQAAARLERHPVLGRLQLQSVTKGGAKSTGTGTAKSRKNEGSEKEEKPSGCASEGNGTQLSSMTITQADGDRGNQKKRLVWTPELHERFLKAIDAVGINQAVPKTLVTIMNVEGLTTEHVKSHLQKYRNSLRKEADEDERERTGRGAETAVTVENTVLRAGEAGQIRPSGAFAVAANSMNGFGNVAVQGFPPGANEWAGCSSDAVVAAAAAGTKSKRCDEEDKVLDEKGGSSVNADCGEAENEEEDEEMKEELQQMQLQLQVMVHRTLALERKMQQSQSVMTENGGGGSGGGGGGGESGEAESSAAQREEAGDSE